MLMVIFGAGASYDSSPDLPLSSPNQWRPPLATALFADPSDVFGDIVKGYDKLRPILPRLRRPTQGTTVEQELEKLRAEADGNPERTRQLFSVRYYLHDLFRRISREWLKRTNRVTTRFDISTPKASRFA